MTAEERLALDAAHVFVASVRHAEVTVYGTEAGYATLEHLCQAIDALPAPAPPSPAQEPPAAVEGNGKLAANSTLRSAIASDDRPGIESALLQRGVGVAAGACSANPDWPCRPEACESGADECPTHPDAQEPPAAKGPTPAPPEGEERCGGRDAPWDANDETASGQPCVLVAGHRGMHIGADGAGWYDPPPGRAPAPAAKGGK